MKVAFQFCQLNYAKRYYMHFGTFTSNFFANVLPAAATKAAYEMLVKLTLDDSNYASITSCQFHQLISKPN